MFTFVLFVLGVAISGAIKLPSKCGVSIFHGDAPELRIIGGKVAKKGYFPWQVFLNKTIEYEGFEVLDECGGSILNEHWVLTAAHCVDNVPNDLEYQDPSLGISVKIDAVFGAVDLNQAEPTQVRRTIKRIIHKTFTRELKVNDIALLELNKPLDFSGTESHLMPVCVPKTSNDSNVAELTKQNCYISGFGWEDKEMNTNDYILHYLREPILPHRECERPYGKYDSTQNLCVGRDDNRGTCKGDSGSSMICYKDGRWTQHGLVSYGIPCANAVFPDVLTNVGHFHDWIVKQN